MHPPAPTISDRLATFLMVFIAALLVAAILALLAAWSPLVGAVAIALAITGVALR